MSEAMRAGPELTAAEHGSLVLTDISGYTRYLLGTELEHAQDVLTDLMGVVVTNLKPPLRVSKLEGDAVFEGDRRTAWAEVAEGMLAGLDHAGAAYVERLEQVARDARTASSTAA